MEEKELPKIDLPEDWVIGTDINKDLLNLYTHYPVRLKCEMFVLCLEGEVKALVNLNEIQVRPNDVITLMPGSIFQINEIIGNLRIYFLGFSSNFIEQGGQSHSMLDAIFLTLGRPAIPLKPEGANMLEKYLQMLIAMYEHFNEKIRHEIAPNLYADIHTGISILYRTDLPQFHATGHTKLQPNTQRKLVCTKVRNHTRTPLFRCKTHHGQNMCRCHCFHGDYGCKVPT